jgi:hypothetical protein
MPLSADNGLGAQLQIGSPKLRPKLSPEPQTAEEAEAQGWKPRTGKCGPLGIAYTREGKTPSPLRPRTIFYTPAGQLAGLAVAHFGSISKELEEARMWKLNEDGHFEITLSFRPESEVCSEIPSDHPIGSELIVNRGVINFLIPVHTHVARGLGWSAGACIEDMGRHWSYDLRTDAKNPVRYESDYDFRYLVPIVPMYDVHTNLLTGIIVVTETVQPGNWPATDDWEVVIPGTIQCQNFCHRNKRCLVSTTGLRLWSNQHWMFTDVSTLTCPEGQCD